MAKQDQRILKFLTQNADRTPTITDMMTRLNISISDITTSLNSLMSQGLVSKRTNGQGIECWFPANGSQSQPAGDFVPEARGVEPIRSGGEPRILSGLNNPAPPEPAPLPPLQPTLPSLSASSAFPASLTATSSAPLRAPSRESAEFSATPSPSPMTAPASIAIPVQESLPGVPAPVPYPLAPVKNGIGFLTFVVGLILSMAASVYFSGRLLKRDFEVAARNFVEKSVLDKAMASQAKFEATAKAHVTALEADVKGLKDQLAQAQAANDSLKLAAQTAEEAGKAAPVAKKVKSRRR